MTYKAWCPVPGRVAAAEGQFNDTRSEGRDSPARHESDGRVIIWDVASGRERIRLGRGTRFPVNGMAVSHDGRFLAAAGALRRGPSASGILSTQSRSRPCVLPVVRILFQEALGHLPGTTKTIWENSIAVDTARSVRVPPRLGVSLGNRKPMTNPWLEIPLADYEGHMALPEVAQATLLGDIFERILPQEHVSASVAILGCAGGNGFDRIDPQVTMRVIGIDINPAYVATARERFQRRLPGLELIVADSQQDEVSIAPVDLVFAALVFEYVNADAVLASVGRLLKSGGFLTTVVQLPHTDGPAVTPSLFTSLQSLSPYLRLLSPETLRERAATHGLTEVESVRVTSLGGKSFQVQSFVASPPECPESSSAWYISPWPGPGPRLPTSPAKPARERS